MIDVARNFRFDGIESLFGCLSESFQVRNQRFRFELSQHIKQCHVLLIFLCYFFDVSLAQLDIKPFLLRNDSLSEFLVKLLNMFFNVFHVGYNGVFHQLELRGYLGDKALACRFECILQNDFYLEQLFLQSFDPFL